MPPKSKSNANRKQCICDWGDACPQFKTFFDKEEHELGGEFFDLWLTNTCDSQNAFAGICSFLHVSQKEKDEIKEKLQSWEKGGKQQKDKPRIKVAKHHYPLSAAIWQTGDEGNS